MEKGGGRAERKLVSTEINALVARSSLICAQFPDDVPCVAVVILSSEN